MGLGICSMYEIYLVLSIKHSSKKKKRSASRNTSECKSAQNVTICSVLPVVGTSYCLCPLGSGSIEKRDSDHGLDHRGEEMGIVSKSWGLWVEEEL